MDNFKEYKEWINQWQDDALEPIEGKTWVELVTLLRLKLDDVEAHVDNGVDRINAVIK